MTTDEDGRSLLVTEPAHTSPLSLLLGFSAMLPIAAGALLAWLPPPFGILAEAATLLWAGAILCFLAGVRRGVSFRTPGGPTPAQIATMLWLFVLGVGALATLPLGLARVLLLLGYVSLAVLDPLAARRGEAPLFFSRLRPVQMAIPIVSILVIVAHDLLRPGAAA